MLVSRSQASKKSGTHASIGAHFNLSGSPFEVRSNENCIVKAFAQLRLDTVPRANYYDINCRGERLRVEKEIGRRAKSMVEWICMIPSSRRVRLIVIPSLSLIVLVIVIMTAGHVPGPLEGLEER